MPPRRGVRSRSGGVEFNPRVKKRWKQKAPGGGAEGSESETAGNCFVAWSRVELLTDRVEQSLSLFDAYCG
jgi:hypothetical protein